MDLLFGRADNDISCCVRCLTELERDLSENGSRLDTNEVE